jgi:hypothetical protein
MRLKTRIKNLEKNSNATNRFRPSFSCMREWERTVKQNTRNTSIGAGIPMLKLYVFFIGIRQDGSIPNPSSAPIEQMPHWLDAGRWPLRKNDWG